MALALTTKLEAVNQLLADIGERPVNSLTSVTRQDVARAITTLDEVSRRVQKRGWWFNTEWFTLTPDGSGFLNVPTGFVRIDKRTVIDGTVINPTNSNDAIYVVRGTKLYDVKNQTDVFTEDLEVLGVRLLDYEELPESAREYVYAEASVLFQNRTVGAPSLDAPIREQARVAMGMMHEENLEFHDFNLQSSPRHFRLMLDR